MRLVALDFFRLFQGEGHLRRIQLHIPPRFESQGFRSTLSSVLVLGFFLFLLDHSRDNCTQPDRVGVDQALCRCQGFVAQELVDMSKVESIIG